MSDDERTRLDFDVKHIICGVHGQPFKPEWPNGYGLFAALILRSVLADERTGADARRIAGLDKDAIISPLLLLVPAFEMRPACCRVSRRALVELYEQCGVGKLARCNNCKRKRTGTPITAPNIAYDHLCFECIAGSSSSPLTSH